MSRTEILKKNTFGLLDVRKIIAMERSWNNNEKFSDLRPFARHVTLYTPPFTNLCIKFRYSSLDKVERLSRGLCFERTLRKRIAELQEVKNASVVVLKVCRRLVRSVVGHLEISERAVKISRPRVPLSGPQLS